MTTQLYMAVAVVLGIAGLLAFPGAMGYRLRTVRLKFAELVLFLAMAAIGIIGYGDKFSPTNNPPNGLNRPMVMMFNPQPAGPTVTETDVARGFSIMSVGTSEVFDFTMPTDSVRVAKWWLRGGSNDKAFVPGGIAMIDGEILDKLPRPTARYCPLKATSLLVAGESEFWHQQTVSNSTVYTWKDAYLLRNLSLPFSMQAEIFGNGEFEYRYDLSRISNMDALTNVIIGAKFGANELCDVSALLDGTNALSSIRFHRLSEFDWDGDGLANEIDPEPYANNGDCHGQGEGWVAACFTNAAEIAAAGGWTNWAASTVANDVDCIRYAFTVTVDNFDATGHSCLSLDGMSVVLSPDSPSATFLLLRGKRYPFSIKPAGTHFSSISFDNAQPGVEYDPQGGIGFVTMDLAVDIAPSAVTLHPFDGYTHALVARIATPALFLVEDGTVWRSEHGWLAILDMHDQAIVSWDGPPGEYEDTLYCETSFGWHTNRQSVVVRYDPDPEAGPHVTLQSPDTVFVNDDDDGDANTNDFENADFDSSTNDDDIVPVVVGFKSVAQPTNGTLRLSAHGLRIWENQNHIGPSADNVYLDNCRTPFERTFYVERNSLAHSGVDSCSLALEWLERAGSPLGVATNRITACEPVAEPICNKMIAHEGTNYVLNPCCIVRGGRDAWFEVEVSPADYPDSKIVWECSEPGVQFVGGNTGRRVRLRAAPNCPLGVLVSLTVRFGDCPSNTPMFYAETTGLVGIRLYHQTLIGRGTAMINFPSTSEFLLLDDIYSQVGVFFRHTYLPPKLVGDDAEIQYSGKSHNRHAPEGHLEEYDGITIFYVQSINGKPVGYAVNTQYTYVVLSPQRSVFTICHEIGHILGLHDIYISADTRNDLPYHMNGQLPPEFSKFFAHTNGWNNGSGARFYAVPALTADVLPRLLMFGAGGNGRIDIPLSSVYGISYSDGYMNSLTNLFAPVGWQNFRMNLDAYGTE